MTHIDTKLGSTDNLELHMQMAMEVGNVAWWEMEIPSGKIRFNANKTKMIGTEAKDFVNYQDFTKLVHAEDYEKIMTAMRDHMEGRKEIYETEYRILCSDGSYKWFYDRGRIVERGENGYLLVMGVVQDITLLKKTILDYADKTTELEATNKLMIGRELKMVELKKEIASLKAAVDGP